MATEQLQFIDVTSGSEADNETFANHVRRGLSKDPKQLSPKYLYDERGSELFDQITTLSEYYPTDKEREILKTNAREVLKTAGPPGTIVEFGSGNAKKTRILIETALQMRDSLQFVPIDISMKFLKKAARDLIETYSDLSVTAIAGTYESSLSSIPETNEPQLFLLLGGSIGNFAPEQAERKLRSIRERMSSNDRFVIGFDLIKNPSIIEAAYNDQHGITAKFNKNILRRINRELDGRFNLNRFQHEAPFVKKKNRVEMHLRSTVEQTVSVKKLEQTVHFDKGESIHTENSYKFTPDSFKSLCNQAGLKQEKTWMDSDEFFGLMMLSPQS